MNDEDFFGCSDKIVACNISLSSGQVCFKTDKITIKYLDENKIDYEIVENKNKAIKRKLMINRGLIIGAMVFVFAILLNAYRVSDITYNANYLINDEIKEEIQKDMKKLFFWDFYGGNLDESATILRRKYVNYQWISLEKKGSKIVITISDYDDSSINKEEDIIGDVVAKKDGIIKYYTIYKGGNNVEVNKYVKKGDVLISSDLLINKNMATKDLVSARGLVLASTYENMTIKVMKEETKEILTGQKMSYNSLELFGHNLNIGKSNSFVNQLSNDKTIFNLFNIIKYKKIQEEEKCDIIKTYNKTEAIEYAKTTIENDFKNNSTCDLEKIERIETLAINETSSYYEITFLVKKQESIGEFQPLVN